MDYVIGTAAVAILIAVTVRILDNLRSVGKDYPASKLWGPIRDGMLGGMDGQRTLLYNRGAGMMITITKMLSPNYSRRGTVRLLVKMARVDEPKRWCVDRARNHFSDTGISYSFVWRWNLPSFDKGQAVFDRDCGASINEVRRVIAELVERADLFGNSPVFYVWSEGRRGRRAAGKFEE